MKTLYIMQGVPGSGKTTVAKAIFESLYPETCVITSTDKYWYLNNPDVYDYDIDKASHAHAWNQDVTDSLMSHDCPNVIVDNTNILKSQARPYIDMAHLHGYAVQIVRVDADLDECLRRNALRTEDRRIPEEVIRTMYSKMEDLARGWSLEDLP